MKVFGTGTEPSGEEDLETLLSAATIELVFCPGAIMP